MQKRALIRGPGEFFLWRSWAQYTFDGWRDAVSSGFSPSASDSLEATLEVVRIQVGSSRLQQAKKKREMVKNGLIQRI